MKYLITGTAGFIGFHLVKKLAAEGNFVVGIDNLNEYYDVALKHARLKVISQIPNFKFIKCDIANRSQLADLIATEKPNVVIHLAAQAGVRYSIDHPESYIESNIIGTFNLLEILRISPPQLFIYASSSSVYGANKKIPFSVGDMTDQPVSFYAATKKANEVMVAAYASLYGIRAIGLRFFTVYGPWGRPDMAYFSFTKNIIAGHPISLYNNGDMYRDFTYIDDIIDGVVAISDKFSGGEEHLNKIYNLGNSRPEKLERFIYELETAIGEKAITANLPMQAGDVQKTYADITESQTDFGYQPKVQLNVGISKFVSWYKSYHQL